MEEKRILIVDDEESLLKVIKKFLEKKGYQPETAKDGDKALSLIKKEEYDIVILDIRMPGKSGFEVLREIRNLNPSIFVIIMTAQNTMDNAIEAMKNGAYDYIVKPFDLDELHLLIERIEQLIDLQGEVKALRAELGDHQQKWTIIGKSQKMQDIFKAIGKVAGSDATILLLGESGTGKELVARAIHSHSRRAGKPFLKVNCAAIPRDLLESELFGHRKGSFTGAVDSQQGKFVYAQSGTLFLDEIGETDINLQSKLLRVLQDKEIDRVGEEQPVQVDVRIIAATNIDLEKAVLEKKFREDLYYRLNVFPIKLPSLRERREDIPLLADYFINKFAEEISLNVSSISEEAMEKLIQYSWPGNVRELENSILRAMLASRSKILSEKDFSFILKEEEDIEKISLHPLIQQKFFRILKEKKGEKILLKIQREVEESLIKLALKESDNSQSKAAQLLGINRNTLRKKIKELKLDKILKEIS